MMKNSENYNEMMKNKDNPEKYENDGIMKKLHNIENDEHDENDENDENDGEA